MHHADSFAIARGGHLDLCVLGAFEVSETGDIANWARAADEPVKQIGGAMDLAIGAKRLWVAMEHTTKEGESRIVQRCAYPLTAKAVVQRVYTNLAVLDVTPRGFVVRDMVAGAVVRGAAGADAGAAAAGVGKARAQSPCFPSPGVWSCVRELASRTHATSWRAQAGGTIGISRAMPVQRMQDCSGEQMVGVFFVRQGKSGSMAEHDIVPGFKLLSALLHDFLQRVGEVL